MYTQRSLPLCREVGIDLSHAKPQKWTQELATNAALLITMGCGDKCLTSTMHRTRCTKCQPRPDHASADGFGVCAHSERR